MGRVCIENLIAAAPRGTEASFYQSSVGAEIDLILKLPDQTLRAIEVKRTTSPKFTRGFHIASEELDVAERLLIYAGDREVPGQGGLCAMPLARHLAVEKSISPPLSDLRDMTKRL